MKNEVKGMIYAASTFMIWGFLTLYWRSLQTIGAYEILVNRMFWGFLTLFVVVLIGKFGNPLKIAYQVVKDKKKFACLCMATILLSTNWFLYIYSMTSGRILEASLGYYINPILNILLGVYVLKEKLTTSQVVATAVAAMGVLVLTVYNGVVPWISLALAFCFGMYGFIKKTMELDSVMSLFFETALMLPISSFFFIRFAMSGTSVYAQGNWHYTLFIVLAGFVTVFPLFLFNKAASLLELKTLGFMQYIQPTIQFFIAVFITGEDFSLTRFGAFVLIWIACLLFSTSHLFTRKKEIVEENALLSS